MTDALTPYEIGLTRLLERLGSNHARYADALVYWQRLQENITQARQYGDTEMRRAERAQIVNALNGLASEAVGESFNELCPASIAPMSERESAVRPTIPVGGSNLPHRYVDFVNREKEIEEVVEALASRAWIITIDGLGGIGKTTLTLEVAHRLHDHSVEGIQVPEFAGFIWTSARDKPSFGLRDVVENILYTLASLGPLEMEQDPTAQSHQARRLLSAEPRLLIVDNFEVVTDEDLHVFLRDLPEPSKAVITSRHHIGTGERVINIGGLPTDEAIRLLYLEAERWKINLHPQDKSLLTVLAEKTYGIPAVLKWAMERVHNGHSLDWVLNTIENASAEDLYEYVFARSLSEVDEQTRRVFKSMAVFTHPVSLEAIAAVNPTVSALRERVSHLVRLSLLEDNRRLSEVERRYYLHPFTHYLAKAELHSSQEPDLTYHIVKRRFATHYAEYAQKMANALPATRDRLETELGNIEQAIMAAIEIAREANEAAPWQQVASLIHSLGSFARRESRKYRSLILEAIPYLTDSDFSNVLLRRYVYDSLPGKSYRELIGRDLLVGDVMTALRDPAGKWIVAINGLGGIGKTAVAREVADRCLAERLFDVVVWEQAPREQYVSGDRDKETGSLTFEMVLDAIARQLDAPDVTKLKGVEKENRVRALLQAERVLIVLDNLKTAMEPSNEITHRLRALLDPSKALLTSRYRFSGDIYVIHLTGLDQEGALRFIRQEAEEKGISHVATAKPKELKQIVQSTGGSPLALKLTVGQLAHLPMETVLDQLRVALLDGSEYSHFYKFIFFPSWRLVSDDSKKLLVSMAAFTPGVGGTLEAIKAVSDLNDEALAQSIDELWRLSLIEVSESPSLKRVRYYLTPLTQYFVLSDIVQVWEDTEE